MPKHSASRRMATLKRERSSGVKDFESATPSMGRRGLKITAAATTGPARGPQPASFGGSPLRSASFQQIQNRLSRARPGATAQVGVNARELPLQGAAPLGIVKPHQELRSDRLGDDLD